MPSKYKAFLLQSIEFFFFLSRQFAFIYKPDKNGSLETLVFTNYFNNFNSLSNFKTY